MSSDDGTFLLVVAIGFEPPTLCSQFRRIIKKSEDGTSAEKQAPTDDPLTSIKWTWGQAVEEAGLGSMVKVGRKKVFKPDAVIHDLRRTFNTVCAEWATPASLRFPPGARGALCRSFHWLEDQGLRLAIIRVEYSCRGSYVVPVTMAPVPSKILTADIEVLDHELLD